MNIEHWTFIEHCHGVVIAIHYLFYRPGFQLLLRLSSIKSRAEKRKNIPLSQTRDFNAGLTKKLIRCIIVMFYQQRWDSSFTDWSFFCRLDAKGGLRQGARARAEPRAGWIWSPNAFTGEKGRWLHHYKSWAWTRMVCGAGSLWGSIVHKGMEVDWIIA